MDRRREGAAVGLGLPPNHWEEPRLPFKANADRRHHIPRPRYRATNWSAYDAALRDRGSLTGTPSVRAAFQPGAEPVF